MGFPSHVLLQTARRTHTHKEEALLLGGDKQGPQLLKMDAENLLPVPSVAELCSVLEESGCFPSRRILDNVW